MEAVPAAIARETGKEQEARMTARFAQARRLRRPSRLLACAVAEFCQHLNSLLRPPAADAALAGGNDPPQAGCRLARLFLHQHLCRSSGSNSPLIRVPIIEFGFLRIQAHRSMLKFGQPQPGC